MKTAVIFKSRTGNTREIAEAIRDELGKEVVYFGEPKNGIGADLYVVGSWTDKGLCDEEILAFLTGLKGQKIAYFGTAGFGGSEAYYQTLYQRVREQIDGSNLVLGVFYCQGRMPEAVRERYEQRLREYPEDERAQGGLVNFEQALGHPDERDRENAKAWIRNILLLC